MKAARKVNFYAQPNDFNSTKPLNESDDNGPDYVPEFISEYVRNKSANQAARKIQTYVRLYFEKKRWRKIFEIKIKNRGSLLRCLFSGWRGYTSNNMDIIERSYDQLRLHAPQYPIISEGKLIAPCNIFYLTGKYFAPKYVSTKNFYYMIRLLNRPVARRFMEIWHSIAHSIHENREKSRSFSFTSKKRLIFGEIFYYFVLWYRYSQWKKQSLFKKNSFKLECTEYIIDWRVLEQTLNMKKARKQRADDFSLMRIVKKAQASLYQEYINSRQYAYDLESSLQFYFHHIQEKGHRAWMRYIEVRRQQNRLTLRNFRNWYRLAYEGARRRTYVEILRKHQTSLSVARVFKAWEAAARKDKLKDMRNMFIIMKNPSTPYLITYSLLGEYELAFFIRSWKEWRRLVERRRNWKRFISANINKAKEADEKEIYYFTLRKAAEYKIIRKLVHVYYHYLQHECNYSVEGMTRDMLVFPKKWCFITETNTKNFKSSMLERALLLVIHKKSHFISAHVKPIEPLHNDTTAEFFDRIRTFDELMEQYNNNREKLRNQLLAKTQRDVTILSIIDSHYSAVRYNNTHHPFIIAPDDASACDIPKIRTCLAHLSFFIETFDSIDDHIAKNDSNPRHKPSDYKAKLAQAIRDFHMRFSLPILVNDSNHVSNLNSPKQQSKKHTSRKLKKLVLTKSTNTMSHYHKPKVMEDIPFENPDLVELQSLKERMTMGLSSGRFKSIENMVMKVGKGTIKLKLRTYSTAVDLMKCMQRYFFGMCDVNLETAHIKNYFTDEILPSDLEQTYKTNMRRNIKWFVAEMNGIGTLVKNMPPYLINLVNAVLTLFVELKVTKFLPYLGETPFADRFEMDSTSTLDLRTQIVNKAIEKNPKIVKELRTLPTFERINSMYGEKQEEMGMNDVYIASFILPLTMKIDMIKDFLNDEIKIEKTIQNSESNDNFDIIETDLVIDEF